MPDWYAAQEAIDQGKDGPSPAEKDYLREMERGADEVTPRHSRFMRCESCGCSFRPPLEGRPMCPLCAHTNEGAVWVREDEPPYE